MDTISHGLDRSQYTRQTYTTLSKGIESPKRSQSIARLFVVLIYTTLTQLLSACVAGVEFGELMHYPCMLITGLIICFLTGEGTMDQTTTSQNRYSTRSPTYFFCPTFFTAAILLASGFGSFLFVCGDLSCHKAF